MSVKALLAEFLHEAENTRKLLNAVTNDIMNFRPNPINWNTGDLAHHIANIYGYYEHTLLGDTLDFSTIVTKEQIDHSKIENVIALFEKNVTRATEFFAKMKEEDLEKTWVMKRGDINHIGPLPKKIAIRGFLYNHIYHHRGELIVYLRCNGLPVPSIYGPTAEQSKRP